MAFDEKLGARVRNILERKRGYGERKMFGGLCFTLRGHMCCGIVGHDLMLRLGEEKAEAALKQKHVRPMDFTGRPMRGFLFIAPEAIDEDDDLGTWVQRCLDYNPRAPRSRKRRSAA